MCVFLFLGANIPYLVIFFLWEVLESCLFFGVNLTSITPLFFFQKIYIKILKIKTSSSMKLTL
jgi:hypothetical protein